MRAGYVFAPEAACGLVEIWRYVKEHSSLDTTERVESVILDKIAFLAATPGAGHRREVGHGAADAVLGSTQSTSPMLIIGQPSLIWLHRNF
jgi:plasmid stabilization system protein ParE